jgi:RNA polymerase sigma-70 factor, ECF subfamily
MPSPSPKPAPVQSDEIDHALLERALRDDAEAWRVLGARIWNRVAAVLGKQSPDVADIVQETCIKIVIALEKGMGPDARDVSAAAWVLTIAVRTAIDHQRKQQRWSKLWAGDCEDVEVEAVEEDHIEKEDTMALDVALHSLSEEHRAIVLLRYRDRRKFREIATILEISENTAKSRAARAKEALLEALNAERDAQLRRFRR